MLGGAGGNNRLLLPASHTHTRMHMQRSHAFLQENLREGGDILRAGPQEDASKGNMEEDNQADAQRKTTLAKLCRALSTIDEHDEGLLSLQQLLQARCTPRRRTQRFARAPAVCSH